MFQDTIDSLYIVLQLVSGDRAHPGKVFTEASAAGVPRISFRRGESPWQLLFLRFFPLILASEVTVSVECHSDSCFFFPSRHQHIGRSECVPSLCKVSALVYVSPSPRLPFSFLAGRGSGEESQRCSSWWSDLGQKTPPPRALVSPSGKGEPSGGLSHRQSSGNGVRTTVLGVRAVAFFCFQPSLAFLPVLSSAKTCSTPLPLPASLSPSLFCPPSFPSSVSLPSSCPIFLYLPLSFSSSSFLPSSCASFHPMLLGTKSYRSTRDSQEA